MDLRTPMPIAQPELRAPKETRRMGRTRSSEASPPPSLSERNRHAGQFHAPLPLVRRTLQDNVYDYIREGLMMGEFSPGEHLTVRGVAGAIGTSIMPVREAFRRLTSEGALEPLSTGATRVPIFDLPKLQDLHDIRSTVEGMAARRAANRITDAELRALERHNADIQEACTAGDWRSEAKANENFHFCIYRAAQSTELLRIIEHLWLQMGPYLAWTLKNQDRLPMRVSGPKTFRHHKAILLAMRRHDAVQAEAAMRADLAMSAATLVDPNQYFALQPSG
jgi:DNA-binding GntR family transcriptional regulator